MLVNMNILTVIDVLTQKDLLEKTAAIKWLEYFRLGRLLKAQTEKAKKRYQGLHKTSFLIG